MMTVAVPVARWVSQQDAKCLRPPISVGELPQLDVLSRDVLSGLRNRLTELSDVASLLFDTRRKFGESERVGLVHASLEREGQCPGCSV
jgi:hypothetical protein